MGWLKHNKNILVILLFCCATLHAQLFQPEFQHLTSTEGLSDYTIYTIEQDQQGFIWMGTRNGLNRYDGYAVKTYYHEPGDSTSLKSNIVFKLFCDRSGVLWVGNDLGLCIYNKRDDHFQQINLHETDKSKVSIHSICQDENGAIWIGMSGGLKKWDPDINKISTITLQIDSTTKSTQSNIDNLVADQHGNLWITGSFGVIRYQIESGACTILRSDELPSRRFQKLAINKKGEIWAATYGGLIAKLDENKITDQQYDLSDFLPSINFNIREMIFDHHNRLWIADINNGLGVFEIQANHFQLLQFDPYLPNGLKNNSVAAVFIDQQHNVWCSEGGAVSHFALDAKQFYFLSHNPSKAISLTNDWVRSFVQDDVLHTWVATADGISIFDKTDQRVIKNIFVDSVNNKSIPSNSVRSLTRDPEGNIWIGTAHGIAVFLEGTKTFKRIKIIPSETCSRSPTFVWAILGTQHGDIYAGSGCGLFKYDKQQDVFLPYAATDTLAILNSESLRSLFEDSSGKLWIGLGKGAAWCDPATGRVKQLVNGPEDVVNAFAEDRQHRIWMASRNGLYRYDPATGAIKHFTVKNGLPNNFCGAVLVDTKNRLWFTNGAGLTCYDQATGKFRNYNRSDGLHSIQFNDQQGFIDNNGYFFMGGREGFIFFHPDSIKENNYPPQVYLHSFKIMDREIVNNYNFHEVLSFRLSHDENFISFEMTAIAYDHADKNQYAYWLEGFDDDWNYTGTRRFGAYTDLPPGRYILHIKASNNDGLWSSEIISIPLHINLPYWQTWWFITSCVLFAAAILYGIYRYRLSQIMQLQSVRNKIARDLHDDVGASLSSIRLYSEAIKSSVQQDHPEAGIILDKIADNSREVVENMSDIVWAINPGNDMLQNLEQRMHAFAAEMCSSKQITLKFNTEAIHQLRVPMDFRKNIFLIFKEAVNNAVKYAACDQLWITITENAKNIVLEVRDNGKGFREENIQSGNGLHNMKKRAEEIRGILTIATAENTGTSVTLKVRIP